MTRSVRTMAVVSLVATLVGVLTVFNISPIFADGPETDPAVEFDKLKEQVDLLTDIQAVSLDCIRNSTTSTSIEIRACVTEAGRQLEAKEERIAELEAELAGVKEELNFFQRMWGGLRGFFGVSDDGSANVPFDDLAESHKILTMPDYLVVDAPQYANPALNESQEINRLQEEVADLLMAHNELVQQVAGMNDVLNTHGKRLSNISKRINWLLDLFRGLPAVEVTEQDA